jgi:hypothetical protein
MHQHVGLAKGSVYEIGTLVEILVKAEVWVVDCWDFEEVRDYVGVGRVVCL